jgi:predicted methyltransferase
MTSSRRQSSCLAFGLAALALFACAPEGPATANDPRIAAQTSATNGFPSPDRPVASIVTSHSGNEEDRDADGEARLTMEAASIRGGMTVADIGAGDGYFTTRLSVRVGAEGKVIATDVTPPYLEGLKARIAREGQTNVSFVLGGFDDPKLPTGSTDVALMVRMYHEIEQPYAFMWRLRDALAPGGVVAISERDRATQDHGTPPALLRCELEAVGYEQLSFTELGGRMGYVAVFAPTRPRPAPEAIRACNA